MDKYMKKNDAIAYITRRALRTESPAASATR